MLVQHRTSSSSSAAAAAAEASSILSPRKSSLLFRTLFSDNLLRIAVASLLLLAAAASLLLLPSLSSSAAILCFQKTSSASFSHSLPPFPNLNSVPPLPLSPSAPFASLRSDRWIVVSAPSSPSPSPSLRRLARIPSWQLLAVADSRTPPDWSLDGAIFLSLDDQLRLGYRTAAHLPRSSPLARKSLAYLFAIHRGARRIFDADDRAIVKDDLSRHFDVDLVGDAASPSVLLQYSHHDPNRTVLNPYVHFGQRSVWPRGLPLENVGQVGHEEFYTEIYSGRQFIQQGLSNGLPDVDSIFYFTRKSTGLESFDIRFDEDAPKVALPQGTMVPVNSFNTLFHAQAFWGLVLPVSVSAMASDVIRGYFAQRILWEIGGFVAVYPPTIYRMDDAESYPYTEERDLHVNVGRLIKFLVAWRSNKPTLFERILQLSYAMAEEGFWTEVDVKLTAAWLQDLLAIGYQQPRLMALELDRPRATIGHGDRKEFVPKELPSVHLGVEEVGSVNNEIENLIRWRKNFGNIVLVLFVSGSVERTALEWRLLYGRIFKTVIILSEHSNLDLVVENGDMPHAYKYLPKVFDRYTGAEGFIFLQDDMILNYWNLLQANKTNLWITNNVPESWVSVTIDGDSNEWLVKQADMVKQLVSNFPVRFQVNYKENMGEESKMIICGSELFYVPRRFVRDFVDLVGLVGDWDIHHKVAVPVFFLAMDSYQNFDSKLLAKVAYRTGQPINGSSLSSVYSTEVPALYPVDIRDELEFIKLIRLMASGDPLLMELV
ncbi:putative glycosyltransferase STELLO2 [Iris pallida]|uniref:Glycosyltransferase STELLO2 n=1 Tax=Iris pallida TaxID=29817 RepID=A0AAX6DG11_IRIPA|nr:putative glycosyltransferase STELLO2 [Iris pallida]